MATERKQSPFPGHVSWRWTANVTAGEERRGGSAAGQGAQRGMAGLFQRRQVRRHFIRIDEGAETDNGDRGGVGFPRQNCEMRA